MKQILTTFTCDRCKKKIAFAYLTDRHFSEKVITKMSERQASRLYAEQQPYIEAYKVIDLCESCQKLFDEWMEVK